MLTRPVVFLFSVVWARRGGDGVGAVVGRERRPKAGACFYENITYGGRYFLRAPRRSARVHRP